MDWQREEGSRKASHELGLLRRGQAGILGAQEVFQAISPSFSLTGQGRLTRLW